MAVGLVDRPVRSRPPAPARRGLRALRRTRPAQDPLAPESLTPGSPALDHPAPGSLALEHLASGSLVPDRLPAPAAGGDPGAEQRRVEGTRVLLEQARALVADGWVQDAFYMVRGRHGETRPVSPFGLLLLSRADVVGACLVGAVAHASAAVDRRERRGRAALAVDTLWEVLRQDPAERADTAHPAARAARVRELARWNDEPGRSRQEVVDLLDRAISRTMTPVAR
jgi:hypothetical protein